MDPLLAKAEEGILPTEPVPVPPVPGSSTEGQNLHPLKSLGQGSLITLVGQLCLIVATFGTRVLMVTNLSSSDYGMLSIGLALTGIISSLCALGIPNAVARQLAHTIDPKVRWKLVALTLEITLPVAVASGVVLFLLSPAMSSLFHEGAETSQLTLVFQLLSINMALGIVGGLLAAFFQGNEDAFPYTLFTQIVNPILTVVFLVVFLPSSKDLTTALLAYIVATSVTLVALTAYTLLPVGYPWRRSGKGEELLGGAPTLTRGGILLFAFPLALVAIATSAVGSVDTIVLGFYRSAAAVGAYNSVLPLARLVALAVGALAYIMLPVTSRLHRLNDMAELRRSYATITKWIVLITLPFFLLFFFLPGPSLSFVYRASYLTTAGYADTPELLQITCLGSFLATLMGPSSSVLIGLGKFRLLVLYTVVSAVVDAGVTFALAPSVGQVGAAVAFASATALLPILCTAQTYRLTGVHPFTPQMVKPLVAVGVPGGLLLAYLAEFRRWTPGSLEVVLTFLLLLGVSLAAVAFTRSVELADSHLLEVVEEKLGRELTFLRRWGRRFLHPEPRPPSEAPPPRKP